MCQAPSLWLLCLLNVTVIWRFSSCFSLPTFFSYNFRVLAAITRMRHGSTYLPPPLDSFATSLPVRVTMYVLDMYNYGVLLFSS